MERTTDTIAAVATPAGRGLSASCSLSGRRPSPPRPAAFRARTAGRWRPIPPPPVYGDLLDREGAVIDKVLATYTRGPGLLHR